MSNSIEKAEKNANENPLRLSEQDVKRYLLTLDINKVYVDEKAEELFRKIKRFVSAKFQSEVDWFLAGNFSPSNTELGKSIGDYMGFHSGNFFEALISAVIIEG